MKGLAHSDLLEILSYDPSTGQFAWRVSRGTRAAGSPAGWIEDGDAGVKYLRIRIARKNFMAHRLAWLYVHGELPEFEIDHIDGDGLNNRISNLRDATPVDNKKNRSTYVSNKSGFSGVSWCRTKGRWRARVSINEQRKTLGYYSRLSDAVAARIAAEESHGYHINHGRGQ